MVDCLVIPNILFWIVIPFLLYCFVIPDIFNRESIFRDLEVRYVRTASKHDEVKQDGSPKPNASSIKRWVTNR